MSYVASVIVDSSARQTDKPFDYKVPENMERMLSKGMRVMVPFGISNKLIQAYVIDIKDKAEHEGFRLKTIVDICDGDIWLDSETMDLAVYLKNEYGCTLSDAIRTILPAGTVVKEKILIKLKDEQSLLQSRKYEKLIPILKDKDYVEFKRLRELSHMALSRAEVFCLRDSGAIALEVNMDSSVRVKTCQIYTAVNNTYVEKFIQEPGRLKKQAQVLKKMLEAGDALTMKELCMKYSCSTAIINGLYEKGFINRKEKEILRNPYTDYSTYRKPVLTEDQRNAVDEIIKNGSLGMNTTLIQGVTGCGKTEIYLHLVERALEKDYGSIVLVPEISLTPQTLERFMGRYGNIVAIIHSRLSEGERYDQWRRIKSGSVKVVVGARSAVFAPVKNLKLIIIDEEHEYTYKSDMTPRYDTREVARFRSDYNNGLLVMGSATPSIESFYKAEKGIINLIQIKHRIGGIPLPHVKIVDMREEIKSGNKLPFSRELIEGISDNLSKGYQTILFLNRRGYSTFVSCRACGYVCKCPNCDTTLTYHMSEGKMTCHYCGFEYMVPRVCPSCGSRYIKYFGTGTEKLEENIKKLFPTATVLRMDMDTTRKKGNHEKIYNAFKCGKGDILIGTQMISKGMDFKNVTLVGIIAADTILNLPDFRSAERTFQLITQVSGRAGRGGPRGRVIAQTYDPDHYSILYAAKQDYEGFYRKEIEIRKSLNNPPFSDIIYVVLYCDNEQELIKTCYGLKQALSKLQDAHAELLGPAPCHISRIKNSFRWHFSYKGDVFKMYNTLDEMLMKSLEGTIVRYSIYKNPYNMF